MKVAPITNWSRTDDWTSVVTQLIPFLPLLNHVISVKIRKSLINVSTVASSWARLSRMSFFKFAANHSYETLWTCLIPFIRLPPRPTLRVHAWLYMFPVTYALAKSRPFYTNRSRNVLALYCPLLSPLALLPSLLSLYPSLSNPRKTLRRPTS